MIVKAKKSHDLPSARWRNRKASGILQSKFKGLRTQGSTGISHGVQRPQNQEFLWLRAGEDGRPSSRRERENPPFLHLFVLSRH